MKFTVDCHRKLARLGRITEWGFPTEPDDAIQCILDHQTPSFLVYTRAGHVPHLTRDVFEKYVKFEQRPIFQIPLPTIFNALDMIGASGKPLSDYYNMETDSLTHLTVADPLGVRQTGHNKVKSIAMWTRGGKKLLDAQTFRSIVQTARCNTVGSLFDYDTPKETLNKRLTKALNRTIDMVDETFDLEPKIHCASFLPIAGGSSNWHREAMAREFSCRDFGVGFSVDLLAFSHGPIVPKYPFDAEEIGELLEGAFEVLPMHKPRMTEGSFDPAAIFRLVSLGVDLFDTSYAVQLAEESKAMRVDAEYPKRNEFEVLDLREEKYVDDFRPLFADCGCYTCSKYTRSYLHHLHNTKEMLSPLLLVM
ncbi:TGT domain-containing protein [Aphelenchoides fujianensis]|nr:TGT domain-containing protein [Aphelenchoides fujianensis]KAI6229759.1 TGT domain-containing protein [Aphelenchoides fujianensis]